MMKFGYLYTDDGMTIYDVSREELGGIPVYVASLSAAPQVSFTAVTEAEAIALLTAFVHHRAWYNRHYLAAHLPMSA